MFKVFVLVSFFLLIVNIITLLIYDDQGKFESTDTDENLAVIKTWIFYIRWRSTINREKTVKNN